MANRSADAGSGSVGSGRGLAPMSSTAPPLGAVAPPSVDPVAPPPPIHHDVPRTPRPRSNAPYPGAPQANAPYRGAPQANAPYAGAPRPAAGHRAARSRESRPARDRDLARDGNVPQVSGLAWVPYLIVLAGAATGMYIVWQGSRYAGRGAAVLGCSLLAAGLARLILPPRYAALLSTRRKASDVLAFAVFGAAVLAVALMLP